MFVFHLKRDGSKFDYDIPMQYIIVATSAAKARKMAATHDDSKWTKDDWLNPEFSKCTSLGVASLKKERIILVEAHEG